MPWGIWLISVTKSKDSLVFANFGCFGLFRVKIMTFLLTEKGQISASHPYGLQKRWLQILCKTIRGLVAMLLHLKKKKKTTNFGTKISNVPILTYQCFWEGFCLQVTILEKSTTLHILKHMFFGKLPCWTSKILW